MKRWIIIILRLVVLASCLIFLIYKVDFHNLFFIVLKKLPLWLLAVSVLLSFLRVWINGVRWKLVNTDNSYQLSRWDYFRYMMISSSFNLVMPGVLGGDLVKAVWVGNEVQSNKTRNVLSIFFDRIVGIFSLIFLGLLAFFFSPFFLLKVKMIILVLTVTALALLTLLIWYIKKDFFCKKIRKWQPQKIIISKIKKFLLIINDIVIYYLNKPRIFIYALLLSVIIHITALIMNYLIAIFLDIRISFLDISIISSLVWLITAVPISIAGIGVREISYITLLGYYGILPESAAALSLYGFLVAVVVGLFGLPFVLTFKRKKGGNEVP